IASETVRQATKEHWDRKRLIETMTQKLRERYPGVLKKNPQWVFSAAGGSMLQIEPLYCGLRESVIFYGTAIPTGGFSGRYPSVDVYDYYLAGHLAEYSEGDFVATQYAPGSSSLLKRGEGKHYRITDENWTLEYMRGNILATFPFGALASWWNGTLGAHYALKIISLCAFDGPSVK
ncbi:MAG: hypothetical protein ACXWP5_12705, partial [Bdellovibrionota bacterium]